MTDLVVYYSRTGKTKLVAETIAKKKNAKLIEIKDQKNRSGPINFLLGAFEVLTNQRTFIKYEMINLSDYDTVYIGTPVWASKPAPAINQFIDQNNFNGINVITFATMSGSGGDSTIVTMNEAIEARGAKVLKSFSLISKNNDLEKLALEAIKD